MVNSYQRFEVTMLLSKCGIYIYLPLITQEYLRRLEPSTADEPVMQINICIPMQFFMKISKN
jgi:hypothetical protein